MGASFIELLLGLGYLLLELFDVIGGGYVFGDVHARLRLRARACHQTSWYG